jgi:general secretion pathway protein H
MFLTRSQTGAHQRGFTLLELMVVVLIMGMGLGLIAISMGRDGASASREEAEEFMRRVSFVAEQVVLNSEVIGLFVEPRSLSNSLDNSWCFRWQRFRSNAWGEITDGLEEHCLPVSLEVDMVVEDEPYEYDPELETQPPVLVFYPSGEATEFEIAIYERAQFDSSNGDTVQRVQIDMMGQLRWLNREAELEAAKTGQ